MRGHIRERSPGHWAIVVEQRDPSTGKRKRKWHSFKGNKRQAQGECTRLLSEIQRGVYVEPTKTTLDEFLTRWLADRKPRVSPNTYERYEQFVTKTIAPLLGSVPIAKLNAPQISAAYTKALETGRRNGKGGLSPRTVHHMHVVLKGALKTAVKWDLLARNPSDNVDPPKVERREMKVYDLNQTAELIETARGERVLISALLAGTCGLRRGEVAALRWRDIDLNSGQLAVSQSAEQTRSACCATSPRSRASRAPSRSLRLS